MNWPLEHLGARAVVLPGFGARDHARAAIQLLSDNVSRRIIFAHTGWRKLGDEWVYLHVGGALGAHGSVPGIQVELPAGLEHFVLPDPASNEKLVDLYCRGLMLLNVAVDTVSVPLFAAICRAPLGGADFGEHIDGPTGVFKTELAALAMQFFGAGFDARHLPASWLSTGNALEGLAFVAKDALLVVDDFAPTGSLADVQRYHREADRLLRAQGNNAGRQRMRPDATLRASKPPRGLIITTGEDIPRGHSLRARLLTTEVGRGDVDQRLLTKAQNDAAEGIYAQLMGGYLRWLASPYDQVHQEVRSQVSQLRLRDIGAVAHRRTPEIIANLMVGLRYFLDFGQEIGAISTADGVEIERRCWAALGTVADAQAGHHRASDPVARFTELLSAAIASGRAHVARPDGSEPNQPGAWGWRQALIGSGDHARQEFRPQGSRVGWVDCEDLFIDVDAAFAVVQEMGRSHGDTIALTPRTLSKRMDERGLLKSKEESRQTLKVRRMLEGRRLDVLHLATSLLVGCNGVESAQEEGEPPRVPGRETSSEPQRSNSVNYPTTTSPLTGVNSDSKVGLVGLSHDRQFRIDREPGSPSDAVNAEDHVDPWNPTNLTTAETQEEVSGEEVV
jgi:hypothetical protein